MTLMEDDSRMETQLGFLLEKLGETRRQTRTAVKQTTREEARSMNFWRCVCSECVAVLFYTFVVCGSASLAAAHDTTQTCLPLLVMSFSAGFCMAVIVHCFWHVSGGHANPAVTFALLFSRNLSLLRCLMYMAAQCGGAIGGAALVYAVLNQSPYVEVTNHTGKLGRWQIFGHEFILTFGIMFAYLEAANSNSRVRGLPSLIVGLAYTTCTFVGAPSLNPARALGPSFIMNKWDDLWVACLAEFSACVLCTLIYEYLLNPVKTPEPSKEPTDGDVSSIHSDEETYDDVDRPTTAKCEVSMRASAPSRPLSINPGKKSNTASPDGAVKTFCSNISAASALYSAVPVKIDTGEPIYGTKSLYSKSPLPARAGLNRSQSVYSKVPSGNREHDSLPRPGPLVPAQSLYPMRFNQNPISITQNIQNQQNQRSESIYGVRGVANSVNRGQTGGVYSVTQNNTVGKNKGNTKPGNGLGCSQNSGSNLISSRPESMYGAPTKRHDSSDSSYGSYHAGNPSNNFSTRTQNHGGNYLNGGKTSSISSTKQEHHSPQGHHHHIFSQLSSATIVSACKPMATFHNKRSPDPQY